MKTSGFNSQKEAKKIKLLIERSKSEFSKITMTKKTEYQIMNKYEFIYLHHSATIS